MTIYFDKANFFSLITSIKNNPQEADVLRFIKRQVNVHFNFLIDELNEYESIIIEEFQDGVAEYVEKIKRKHCVLIGNINEELSTLNKLIFDSDDYGFHTQKIIGPLRFDNWNRIEPYCLPFSTLLIVDRYMFKGHEEGGNLGLFDFNIAVILKKFYENKEGPSQLIFVYQTNPFVNSANTNFDRGPDIDVLKSKTKKAIKAANKHCPAPNIVFVGVPNGRIKDEHDRNIITNYMRLKSGDSLIYFKSDGSIITKSNDLDIYSMGKKEYRNSSDSLISKIRLYVIETIDTYPHYCSLESGLTKDDIIIF